MTRLSVHQPSFMPYLGFWSKFAASDVFLICSQYQFSNTAFIHRVKVGTDTNYDYFTLPIQYNFPSPINEVKLKKQFMAERWNILVNKHADAPYWSEFSPALYAIWQQDYVMMSDLNIKYIEYISKLLSFPTRIIIQNNLPDENATEKIQKFCDKYNATLYVAGSAGRRYMDLSKLTTSILFNEPKMPENYKTVSIVSALFNKGLEWTRQAILDSINLVR